MFIAPLFVYVTVTVPESVILTSEFVPSLNLRIGSLPSAPEFTAVNVAVFSFEANRYPGFTKSIRTPSAFAVVEIAVPPWKSTTSVLVILSLVPESACNTQWL